METLELAKILKENETLIGEVYQECQRLFPDYAAYFAALAREESGHAELFEEIIGAISSQTHVWQAGKVSLQTARVVNERLKATLTEIKQNQVAPRYAITFALSFELSMSEKDFCRLLVSSDPEWQKRLSIISQGFSRHYKKLLSLEKSIFSDSQKMDFTSL
jgi:rubrerythrin